MDLCSVNTTRQRIFSSINWNSTCLLHPWPRLSIETFWCLHPSEMQKKKRLIVEAPNVLESITLHRHHDWTNKFNAILSCTHKSFVRKISPTFFDAAVLRPCQNSIIDRASFSMLQTDTLQFTQIAQTIDKLVFHLAEAKKEIFNWKSSERKKTISIFHLVDRRDEKLVKPTREKFWMENL